MERRLRRSNDLIGFSSGVCLVLRHKACFSSSGEAGQGYSGMVKESQLERNTISFPLTREIIAVIAWMSVIIVIGNAPALIILQLLR